MKKNFGFALAALFSALISAPGGAKTRMPAIFGDHMVVQRDKPVAVWGTSEKGEKITLALAGESKSVKADAKGRWKALLPALKAGGPYELTIAGKETLVIHDVLVGEVWIGSGQSNMEFPMSRTRDAGSEIAAAKFRDIRLFTVQRAASVSPQKDVVGSWKVCSPESVKDFSAVAYHFGKEIHKALKVPVGLIASDWGGTPAEDWVPRSALNHDPGLAALAKGWEKEKDRTAAWSKGMPFDLWLSDIRLVPKDKAAKPLSISFGKGNPAGAEKALKGVLSHNENPGSKSTFESIEKSKNGEVARYRGLMMGGGWGSGTVELSNGNRPADLSAYEGIEFKAKGRGKFSVRLGQPSISDGDYYGSESFQAAPRWKSVRVSIPAFKQGGWGKKKILALNQIQNIGFGVQTPYWPESPSVTYNGMIAPLTPFRIGGVLWYQGESNAGRPSQYRVLLSTLIQSWRKAWREGDFPFLIVQLPNFMQVQAEPGESGWAELREAQVQTLKTPRTALVTTIDLGEANDIHPKNKTDVGKRLALTALGTFFGKPLVYSGPQFESLTLEKDSVRIHFKHVEGGLLAKGGGKLRGFALAGRDHKFHWADAKIEGETVVVTAAGIEKPKEVRYAWADNPVCNLFNKDGFPATPFRTRIPAPPGKTKELSKGNAK